ncbi:tyrosine-type recombinase/integrase [Streptomyces sp. NPDC001286]
MAYTWPRIDVCFGCLPGGPHIPPPCLVCGRAGFFYHQGLCTGCHPFSPDRRDACRDCYAWGIGITSKGRCWGCLHWHRKFTRAGPGGPCVWCRRTVALNHDRVCRMCWVQRARLRRATGDVHASYDDALACGWIQLSFANTRAQEHRPARAPLPLPVGGPLVAFTHRQLTLFAPTSSRRLTASDGVPRDPVLAGWLERELTAWARSRGWSRTTLVRCRRGLRILLAVQDTPGGPIPASTVQQLSGADRGASLLREFLTDRRFLEDDLPATVDVWFARTTAFLPEPMRSQIAYWFTTRLSGRTQPPRSHPCSPITMRLHLRFALPVLTRLAAAGLHDLTHVTAAALREHLAACHLTGSDYVHTASALRTVFTFLHTHDQAPRNPASHLRVGTHHRPLPLPADLALIRDALTSPDPARAAITALLAFHALRLQEIRHLTLTDLDLDRGRLHLPQRTVLLAEPVQARLAAYLTHRTATWPRTANLHLFLTMRSAATTTPASHPWLHRHYPTSSHLLRADRIADEAQRTADTRMICELFGLSYDAATRYTRPYTDAAAAAGHRPEATPHPRRAGYPDRRQ